MAGPPPIKPSASDALVGPPIAIATSRSGILGIGFGLLVPLWLRLPLLQQHRQTIRSSAVSHWARREPAWRKGSGFLGF
jgi:hypothetical protein